MSLYSYDLDIAIHGYTFHQPRPLEGIDTIAVAYGKRYERGRV